MSGQKGLVDQTSVESMQIQQRFQWLHLFHCHSGWFYDTWCTQPLAFTCNTTSNYHLTSRTIACSQASRLVLFALLPRSLLLPSRCEKPLRSPPSSRPHRPPRPPGALPPGPNTVRRVRPKTNTARGTQGGAICWSLVLVSLQTESTWRSRFGSKV